MSIAYDENLLLGYLEGDLGEADRRKVEQWLADDPRLRRLMAGMAADRDALRQAPEPAVPGWIMDEVDRRLERSMLLDASPADFQAHDDHQRFVLHRVMAISGLAALFIAALSVVMWSVLELGGPKDDLGPAVAMDRTTEANDTAEAPATAQTPPATQAEEHADADEAPDEPEQSLASAPIMTKAGPMPGSMSRESVAAANEAAPEPQPESELAEAVADEAPAEPPVSQVVVQTRDVNRSLDQLNFVASNIFNARLEAEPEAEPVATDTAVADAPEPGAADEPQPVIAKGGPGVLGKDVAAEANAGEPEVPALASAARQTRVQSAFGDQAAPNSAAQPSHIATAAHRLTYNLRVPPDQVANAIDMLQADPNDGYQQVDVQRRPPAEQQALRRVYARNWPSLSPDYGNILRQQLPLSPDDVALVDIPVVIEAMQAPPAEESD